MIKAALDNYGKDQWIMNSNRIAVFAASMQCTDEVKVVSRGTPRSQTPVTGEFKRRKENGKRMDEV